MWSIWNRGLLHTFADATIWGYPINFVIGLAVSALGFSGTVTVLARYLGGLLRGQKRKPKPSEVAGIVGFLAVFGLGLWSYNLHPSLPTPTLPLPNTYKLESVSLLSASEAWAVGDEGLIAHYHNSTWVAVQSPAPSKTLMSVAMTGSGEGWAVGADGIILHCSNGVWSVYKQPSPGKWYRGIAMTSSSDGWIVGDAGSLLHYHGGSWGAFLSGTQADLFGIAMVSPRDGWAVGQGGTVLHYNGVTWMPEGSQSLTTETLNAVAAAGAADVWAVGEEGVTIHYDGATWRSIASGAPGKSLHGVAALPGIGAWAVGQDGTLLQAASGGSGHGTSWAPLSAPSAAYLTNISFLPSGQTGWIVGENALWHYTGGGWFPYPPSHT